MTGNQELRFGFGKNWAKFIKGNFNRERVEIAKKHILEFLGRQDLNGLDFLDIGCGSGLHSLAAHEAGAKRIHSFDYDPDSVATTRKLWEYAGSPSTWTVEQGDALNEEFVGSLGTWSLVYSWGVLHHTGDVWKGIRNAQKCVAEGGQFYLALYSSDVQDDPEYWLRIKREYNQAGRLKREAMVAWYVGKYDLGWKVRNVPRLIKRIVGHRLGRGMSYFTDIRDWLGGWPMEFVRDQDVIDAFTNEFGCTLDRIKTGEACTEFLLRRVSSPDGSATAEAQDEVASGVD